ncbi:Fic family protein [Candidatus Woesearchaeota archaeon]|nr:Fic family protein [Candidatus Woesearchaeota archaeon]
MYKKPLLKLVEQSYLTKKDESLIIRYFNPRLNEECEDKDRLIPSYKFPKRLIDHIDKNLVFKESEIEDLEKTINLILQHDAEGLKLSKLFYDSLEQDLQRHSLQIDPDLKGVKGKEYRRLESNLCSAAQYLDTALRKNKGLLDLETLLAVNAKIQGLKHGRLRPDYRLQRYALTTRVGGYPVPNKRLSELLTDLLAFLNSNIFFRFKKLKNNYYEFSMKDDYLLSIFRAFTTHLHLVLMHLFLDGNGRTSRLLQMKLLTYAKLPPAGIPKNYTQEYTDKLASIRAEHHNEIFNYYNFIGFVLEENKFPTHIPTDTFKQNLARTVFTRYMKPLPKEQDFYNFLFSLYLTTTRSVLDSLTGHSPRNATVRKHKKKLKNCKNYTNPYK